MIKKTHITFLFLFFVILPLSGADLGWDRIIDAEVTDFGSFAVYPGAVLNNSIIMGTGRNSGAWIISSPDSYNTVLDELSGIDDEYNLEIIPAHTVYDGWLYCWTSNSGGTEIWRSDDGVTWAHVAVSERLCGRRQGSCRFVFQ
jgi:hypothetical protein